MELALYCPVYGYYERDADSVGKRGDFQTSVSVGPLFGELLAARCAGGMDELAGREPGKRHLVEAGAHNGQLAFDILRWLIDRRPDLLEGLTYHLVEPSRTRRAWQRTKLKGSLERVRWSSNFNELREATGGVSGLVFSNEVLDALPVHRFAWDLQQQKWFEWLVDEEDGSFLWSRGGAPDPTNLAAIRRLVPQEILDVLPDGYVVENSPAAAQWWREAADSLSQGWLIAFDYGFDTNAALLPGRAAGTLRGYCQHQVTADVLSSPGEQDITAHVHFGHIRATGEERGMRTEFFGEQGGFLVWQMAQSEQSTRNAIDLGPDRLRQLKTLIHPDHFGHTFKVLVQSRL